MAKKSGRVKRSAKVSTNRKIQVTAGAIIVGMILFGLIIPVTAMQFENHNGFCASCHTEGEQTFYNRSTDYLTERVKGYCSPNAA